MALFVDTASVEGRLNADILQWDPASQATAASTLTLTAASTTHQIFTGTTSGQIVRLPVATTLVTGWVYVLINESTQFITVQDSAGTQLLVINPGRTAHLFLRDASTAAGAWSQDVVGEYTATIATTNGTQTVLALISIPTDTVAYVEVDVLCRRTGGSAGNAFDSGAWVRRVRFRNVAGVVSQAGLTTEWTSKDQTAFDATLDFSGAAGRILVTGALNENLNWVAYIKVRVLA